MHACPERMQELKLGQIRGFGGKLGTSLEEAFGVVSAGDAQALSVEQLARHLGGEAASARCVLRLCCGPCARVCVLKLPPLPCMQRHLCVRRAGRSLFCASRWLQGLQGAPGMAHEHGATPLPS